MEYTAGFYRGQNSELMLCMLEDGVFLPLILTMVMLHGDPLLRRVNEIIDRVVEAGIYNYWISLLLYLFQLRSRKMAIVIPFEEYYNFNLYHMQPAFYLVLMGWCLSAISFVVELLYHHVISKRMWSWKWVCCYTMFDYVGTTKGFGTQNLPVCSLACVIGWTIHSIEAQEWKILENLFLAHLTSQKWCEECSSSSNYLLCVVFRWSSLHVG